MIFNSIFFKKVFRAQRKSVIFITLWLYSLPQPLQRRRGLLSFLNIVTSVFSLVSSVLRNYLNTKNTIITKGGEYLGSNFIKIIDFGW